MAIIDNSFYLFYPGASIHRPSKLVPTTLLAAGFMSSFPSYRSTIDPKNASMRLAKLSLARRTITMDSNVQIQVSSTQTVQSATAKGALVSMLPTVTLSSVKFRLNMSSIHPNTSANVAYTVSTSAMPKGKPFNRVYYLHVKKKNSSF